MNKTLYEILEMNRKNSTLKSVFVTERFTEGCLIIEVDAWDNTGYKALKTTVSRFDRFYDYLNKTIIKNFSKLNNETDAVRVIIYGTYNSEYIITNDGSIY